ncbi:MAG: MATE family efflux transporter [Myxococcales bacterium]|nr:MATE family efflux transporter [Myxococcales bacterium]
MDLASNKTVCARSERAQGGIREVFLLAYPVILTQLSTTAMSAVDSAMVGRLGATQLGAVGFAGIWLWTLFSPFYGTASGVQTFVSQAHGAGHPRECGRWMWQAAYAVVPAALLAGLLYAALVQPALWLVVPSQELRHAATLYFWMRLPGEAIYVASMLCISFFRGLGDTRTPLYITLAVNVVNAVLDYGLIFGRLGMPEWGVAGAGIATSLATLTGLLALLWTLRRPALRRRFRTARIPAQRAAIRRFLRTGAPIGGQWFFDMMAFALFTTLVARMGDEEMAATQALLVLLSLSFMQAVGISVAASTLVGRYIGAGALAAAHRAYRSALTLGAILSSIVALLFVTIPRPLLRIFTDEASVLELGLPLVWLGAVFQYFDNAAIVSEGALRGGGDTRWPFVVQTALNWLFFLPFAYTLAVRLDFGLLGAWTAELTYMALLAACMVWRFEAGVWKRTRI